MTSEADSYAPIAIFLGGGLIADLEMWLFGSVARSCNERGHLTGTLTDRHPRVMWCAVCQRRLVTSR